MKSKFVKSLGLTVAMVACAGMTALAAPSPSAKVEQTTTTEASSPKKIYRKSIPCTGYR